jgi:hypothetical protein
MSLASLALQGRYQGSPPFTPYIVGVDARYVENHPAIVLDAPSVPPSIWFEQCQQQRWQRANPQSGMNPALRVFFFRVANLVRQPIQLIFCYDGPNRPARKRGKNVCARDHWMVKPTRRILDAFNIAWHEVSSHTVTSDSLCGNQLMLALPPLAGTRRG